MSVLETSTLADIICLITKGPPALYGSKLDPTSEEDHRNHLGYDIVRQKQTPPVELLLYSVSSFGPFEDLRCEIVARFELLI